MSFSLDEDSIKPIKVLDSYLTNIAKTPADNPLVIAVKAAIASESASDIDNVWYYLYEEEEDLGFKFDIWVMKNYGQ